VDPAFRKVFVRGLPFSCTSEQLRNLFASHGEIEEAAVIMDKSTGTCKGYGFVTYKDVDSTHNALDIPVRKFEGREIHCNLAAVGANSNAGENHRGGKTKDNDDISLRKLFCRGLSYDTSNESFLALFSPFGDIEEGSIARDRNTGQSRGYGFITFKSKVAAMKALENPEKQLDGRTVHINLASNDSKGVGDNNIALRKIFVRGLNYETTQESFQNLFRQFGEMEECNIAADKQSGKSKGYGFVTYLSAVSAMKCLETPQKHLDGRTVSCNLAEKGKKVRLTNPMQPRMNYGYQQPYPYQQPYGVYPQPAPVYAAYPQPTGQAQWSQQAQTHPQAGWPPQPQGSQAAQPPQPGYPYPR